jgi:RNA polymerase sigma factor (sigma-70 family)
MATGVMGNLLQYLRGMVGRGRIDDQTDGQLLEDFAARGDAAAFETLLQRHGDMVWQVCRRLLPNASDVEDAFQAVFLVLLRKAASLDRTRSLGSWLYGVAYRVALKARSRAHQQRRKETEAAARTPVESHAEPGQQELRPLLDAELARLPEKYRAPLILCYLEGKTNQEAALALGWPIGSISKKLAQGRELLRDRLVNRGLALSAPALLAALAGSVSAAPASLAASTLQAATCSLVGPTTTGAFAAGVIKLAEGVMSNMGMMTKLKILAIMVVLTGLCGGGVLLVPHAGAVRNLAPAPERTDNGWENNVINEKAKRLELHFDSAWAVKELNMALATVGRFPTEDFKNRPQDGTLRQSGAVALGLVIPQLARADQLTQVFLVGPTLHEGAACRPAVLTRQDNVFTLVMETWTDNTPRAMNRLKFFLPVTVLSLGQLAASRPEENYELRIVWRDLYQDAAKGSLFHECRKQAIGSIRFQVLGAGDPAPKDSKAPSLQQKDLKEVEVPAEQRSWLRQRVTDPLKMDLLPEPELNRDAGMELRVGAFNQDAWRATNPKRSADMPTLTPPPRSSKDPVYAALLGPVLNSGDGMTLREIAYKDRQVILRMDVWRDAGERRRNILQQPLLITPLTVPGPGEYKVEVEWTFLRAASHQDPSTREAIKKSEAKLKIE